MSFVDAPDDVNYGDDNNSITCIIIWLIVPDQDDQKHNTNKSCVNFTGNMSFRRCHPLASFDMYFSISFLIPFQLFKKKYILIIFCTVFVLIILTFIFL